MPIKLVKRPKSPFWVMRGTIRGIRVEECTGTADKKAAEEIRAKREAEILQQSIHGRVATVTFAEAALSYLDHGGSKRFLDKVVEHFKTTPLAGINQEKIDLGACKVYPTASGSTRNRQFYTPVSAVITHAARRGWCAPLLLERPEPSEERAISRTRVEGTCLKTLRYQCTMQRCQAASGNNSAALSASLMQASEVISRTCLRPRFLRCLRNALQPASSSFAPSQMPRISR